ncbi:MAG: hypothetical protein HWD61_15345 [Parachlamydiaceae bacterium]|nr:MAG: hypothetical protein HWD61_15345 [Parachlamydiaceae bacterium]
MDVTIQHGRAVFAPFTPDEDKDPQTKKFGIKAYNKIIGVILKVFGIAERIDVLGPENKSLYVNKNSFKDWQRRHEINRKITKHLTPEEFIKDVVSLAQLNKQIKTQPTSEAYFERAKFYFNHKDFSKGEEDLNRAILENPTTGKYAEEYIYFLLSKAKDDKSSKFNALKDALQVTSKLLLKDPDYRFTSEGKFYAGKPLLLVRAALYNEIHNLKSDRYRLENKKGLNDEKKKKIML